MSAFAPTPPMVTVVSSYIQTLLSQPSCPPGWDRQGPRCTPNPLSCLPGLLSEKGAFLAEESRQRLAEVALAYAKAGE